MQAIKTEINCIALRNRKFFTGKRGNNYVYYFRSNIFNFNHRNCNISFWFKYFGSNR